MGNNNIYYLAQKKSNYKNHQYRRDRFNKRRFLIAVFLLIVFILFIYFIGFYNRIVIVRARYGELVDGFTTKALIVRDEQVYYSPVSGNIELNLTEGSRISYGQRVMRVGDYSLINHRAGIISYATDGLEDSLGFESIIELTPDKYNKYKRNYKQLVNGNYLNKGEPAFRIIANNMYLVLQVTTEEIERYWLNEKVFLKAPDIKKGLIDARVVNKMVFDKKALMLVKLIPFVPEWLNNRWVEVEFIKNIYRGIIIPYKALFIQPEGEGVLVYNTNNGKIEFKKVKVLERTKQGLIVEGIEIGESIIENPSSVDYGKGV
ncbi:MAG: hypothetical protein FH762_17025 [Firmicutes bacterium]|nr:hypothetical protein [Bacillota bacterium]